MTTRTHARLNLSAGVAALLWVARPVPAIVALKLGHEDVANSWFRLIAPTLVSNAMVSPLVWLFVEVPVGLVVGIGCIAKGLRR